MGVGTAVSAGSSIAGVAGSLMSSSGSGGDDSGLGTIMLINQLNNRYNDLSSDYSKKYSDLSSEYRQNNQASQDALQSAYNQVRTDETPYMNLGTQGANGYSNLLSDPSSITSNPGYQFQLNEGLTSLDRSAAAKGLVLSGAQQKAVTNYGQDYASTSYDKALTRYLNAANLGQTATSQVNSAGTTTAANQANSYSNLNNALNSLNSTYTSGMSGANSTYTSGLTAATGQSSTSQTASSAQDASNTNSTISGVVNSLNSGAKNLLTSSGYGTSGGSSSGGDNLLRSYFYGS
jgi:hypothetical protein